MRRELLAPALLFLALSSCDDGSGNAGSVAGDDPSSGGGDGGSEGAAGGGGGAGGFENATGDETATSQTPDDVRGPDPDQALSPTASTDDTTSVIPPVPPTPNENVEDPAGGAGGNDGLGDGGAGASMGGSATGGGNDPGKAGAGGSPEPVLYEDSGTPPEQLCPVDMATPAPPITLDARLGCHPEDGIGILGGKETDDAHVVIAMRGEGTYLAEATPSGVTFDALGYRTFGPLPFFDADGDLAVVANVGSPVGMALWKKQPDWSPETIIVGVDYGYGFDAPLARAVFLGSDGQPSVFHSSSQIITRSADGLWTPIETPYGLWSGLELDSQGRFHLIYAPAELSSLQQWIDGTTQEGTSSFAGFYHHPATAINSADTIAVLPNAYSVMLVDDAGFGEPMPMDTPEATDDGCTVDATGGTCDNVEYTQQEVVVTEDGSFWIALVARREDLDFEFVDDGSGGRERNPLDDRRRDELYLLRLPGDGSGPPVTRFTLPLEYLSTQRLLFAASGPRLYVGILEYGDVVRLIGVDWTAL